MKPEFSIYFTPYLAQASDAPTKAIIVQEKEDPITVQQVPAPPSAGSVLNYGVQGIVYGIVISFITVLGKPLFETLQLSLSEKAREKQSREKMALESQIQLQATLAGHREDQQKMQTFMQNLLTEQSKGANDRLSNVFTDLTIELRKIESSNREVKDQIQALLKGHEALKVEITRVNHTLPIRIINAKIEPNDES